MGFKLTLNGTVHEISIARRRPHLVLLIDGQEHELTALPSSGDGRHDFDLGGHRVSATRATVGDRQIVRLGGRTFDVGLVDPFAAEGDSGGGRDVLRAPMPGAVVSVQCAVGDTVARGQPLITIESMKLQTALVSPRDGIVATVTRGEGQTFEKDEIIVTLQPQTGEA